MKISYVLQLKDFSIFLVFGLLLGVFYEIINTTNYIKKYLIIQIIIDTIFSLASIITIMYLLNKFNKGQIRIFLIISYTIGFIIERITLGKLFAKGYKKLYNLVIRWNKALKQSKLGRIIFK